MEEGRDLCLQLENEDVEWQSFQSSLTLMSALSLHAENAKGSLKGRKDYHQELLSELFILALDILNRNGGREMRLNRRSSLAESKQLRFDFCFPLVGNEPP